MIIFYRPKKWFLISIREGCGWKETARDKCEPTASYSGWMRRDRTEPTETVRVPRLTQWRTFLRLDFCQYFPRVYSLRFVFHVLVFVSHRSVSDHCLHYDRMITYNTYVLLQYIHNYWSKTFFSCYGIDSFNTSFIEQKKKRDQTMSKKKKKGFGINIIRLVKKYVYNFHPNRY